MQEDIIKLNEYIAFIEGQIAAIDSGTLEAEYKVARKIELITPLAALINAKIIASVRGSARQPGQDTGATPASAPAKVQNPSTTFAAAQARVNTTCEKCGAGIMSIREAKSGPRAGKRFLGCSNFKGGCKNTVNIEG